MRAEDPAGCPNCRRLQARVDALEAELAALKEVVARLSQQLAAARKDSSTSSKPPSSDLVKPPKPPPKGQDRRRIGGQPGHPKHERAAFPPELVNGGSFDHRLDTCPACGHGLHPTRTLSPRVVQQVDICEVPLTIQEHRSHLGWCPGCQKMYEAPLPPGIARGGLVGPSLTTLIAYLKGACHASFSTIRKFLRDVAKVTISRGELARIIGKVSRALERPYEELLEDLPVQARLNIDETGHKQNGQRQWTWCFRAGLYTLFKIDPTRSADVLIAVLGAEFDGVLGCDYFSSYRRYQREFGVVLQFCLAHLIRDVKYLTTLPDVRDRAYGERLREALRQLFAVIHRREELSAAVFQSQLEAARVEVMRRGTQDVPETRSSRNLAKRLEKHGESYFRFVTTPDVEPTNNLAEQAIRFVVLDRLVTQGTRSESGNRWCERIWTVIATREQQGRSVFAYLEAAVTAWFEGTEAPSPRCCLRSEGSGAAAADRGWARVQGPMGPGRPEVHTPVKRVMTDSGPPPARPGGEVGIALRRAGGRPSASVPVRTHLAGEEYYFTGERPPAGDPTRVSSVTAAVKPVYASFRARLEGAGT